MDETRELRAVFSGRVQGVGFRWRTLHCLEGRGLRGYVRNLDDGRVELRLQGSEARIDAALAEVEGRLGPHIEAVEVERGPAREPLEDFGIRG